jgi:hypothetical protein
VCALTEGKATKVAAMKAARNNATMDNEDLHLDIYFSLLFWLKVA